jgi:hypothetical protein
MENLNQFVNSQKGIKKVSLIFEESDYSDLIPTFTQLLNLDSLTAVKISLHEDLSDLPVENINSRRVQELYVKNIEDGEFVHCLRMFPAITRLGVNLTDLLLTRDIIPFINGVQNLEGRRFPSRVSSTRLPGDFSSNRVLGYSTKLLDTRLE